jgi:hypothetical protein
VQEITMSRTLSVVLSDSGPESEEALGRVFNAMFPSHEIKERGEQVALVLQGAGARWPAGLVKPLHPGHALYNAVRETVAGVCGGCADVLGATEAAAATGLPLRRESKLPGTIGILDLSRHLADSYRMVTF